jgi:hypothetical protein
MATKSISTAVAASELESSWSIPMEASRSDSV